MTRKHYKITSVFVDQASKLSYVYIQQSTDAASTIQAKWAFEAYARALGVKIKHHHADNGVFNSQDILANIEQSRQTISFCGVGAHHQSGVAKSRVLLEYASNAEAWLARTPALFTRHTHQPTRHCYVIVLQQTSLFSIFRSYDRPRAQITKVRNMLPIAQ